ncbi:MAG: hypothetical protein U1E42_07280 [Rhodospirillales bacterium]
MTVRRVPRASSRPVPMAMTPPAPWEWQVSPRRRVLETVPRTAPAPREWQASPQVPATARQVPRASSRPVPTAGPATMTGRRLPVASPRQRALRARRASPRRWMSVPARQARQRVPRAPRASPRRQELETVPGTARQAPRASSRPVPMAEPATMTARRLPVASPQVPATARQVRRPGPTRRG